MGLYAVAVCYNARQDNTVQFNTVQQHTSHQTRNTQDNPQYVILQKPVKNTYYALRTIVHPALTSSQST